MHETVDARCNRSVIKPCTCVVFTSETLLVYMKENFVTLSFITIELVPEIFFFRGVLVINLAYFDWKLTGQEPFIEFQRNYQIH